jgi:hypothetical protein
MAIFGINFRETAGFVTDGTDETYCLNDAYPTTRGGLTFGVVGGGGAVRDRSAAVDRRLAGIMFFGNNGAAVLTFRIDLPSTGTWDINLALGDQANPQETKIVLKDDTTTFATIGRTSTSAHNYLDATGTNRTGAAWPTDNVAISRSFTTTSFFLELGDSAAGANNSCIAHIRIESASDTSAALTGSASTSGHGTQAPVISIEL